MTMLDSAFRFIALTFCLCFILVNAIAQNTEQSEVETQTDQYGRWKNGVTEDWAFELSEKYTVKDKARAQKLWNEIAKHSDYGRSRMGGYLFARRK
jgi:hypothetical protein